MKRPPPCCWKAENPIHMKSRMRRDPHNGSLAWFGIYERSYRFDPEMGQFADGEPQGLAELRKRVQADARGAKVIAEFALNQSEYTQRIDAIHELIRAGDVYQLNFTAPWRVTTSGSAAALYARLRAQQPAEYG